MILKPSEYLARTREVILERSWTRNHWVHPDDGSVCLAGAYRIALGGIVRTWAGPEGGLYIDDEELVLRRYEDREYYEASQLAQAYLRHVTANNVIAWNDRRCTGEAEVLNRLDDAILLAKENGH